ncbi:hypothetical protein EHO59_14180 [Leptospira semungkisensis]|uniref:Uncharacterized protein n=1 Tax=Leptospira semungkisensis TaxID=2484985 RepID=A0A4R9FRV0_9LEPT|nr:hypothetical protein EHO59_14180 [Leptospira semungkisensis]
MFSCNLDFTNYPIANLQNSKEEVVVKAIQAAEQQDVKALSALALTANEHNTMFWNHVGEKFTSDAGMTPQLAYDHMTMESNIVVKELFFKIGGKDFILKNFVCKRAPEKYGPFTLHMGCISTLYSPTTKETLTLSSFRTILEYKGKYKLYHLKRE